MIRDTRSCVNPRRRNNAFLFGEGWTEQREKSNRWFDWVEKQQTGWESNTVSLIHLKPKQVPKAAREQMINRDWDLPGQRPIERKRRRPVLVQFISLWGKVTKPFEKTPSAVYLNCLSHWNIQLAISYVPVSVAVKGAWPLNNWLVVWLLGCESPTLRHRCEAAVRCGE